MVFSNKIKGFENSSDRRRHIPILKNPCQTSAYRPWMHCGSKLRGRDSEPGSKEAEVEKERRTRAKLEEEEEERMEGEVKNLIKVMLWVMASMTYARFASSKIPPGTGRLLCLLPVLCLLPWLPWSFSTVHLRAISAFFLVWLALFKLLLLSFGFGPLHPSLPLLTFVSTASLPVKLRDPAAQKSSPPSSGGLLLFLSSAIKAALFVLLISLYGYRHLMHPYLLLALYCCHVYLALELVLASVAALARAFLRLELEPQFDALYRASSLQDFWGRRWNLMVTGILRPTVYNPVRAHWSRGAAVFATFLVSGLMHEVLFYYLTLAAPTGEVTAFFVLHGFCVVVEVRTKRRLALHPAVAVPLAVGFVAVTGSWLFFPPVLRTGTDEKALEECAAVMEFLEDSGRTILSQLRAVLYNS